ncbi:MAG: hypothetical protein QOE82_2722 [Thermoanaerobaculia bacterium]|jgi:hypothetical protein|nr:hypothetical protein [Thermoanaerobaculia bacterium]
MFGEAVDTPRNEADAAKAVDRALHRRGIANDVFTFRSA